MKYFGRMQSVISKSTIGLGCEALGGTDWGTVDIDGAVAAVRTAWDGGILTFDTADVYGLGQSERRLADALGDARHDAVIITKFGIRWRKVANSRAITWRDASASYVVEALEASLRRLQIDRIPVYLVHWPDARTSIEETLGALERQRLAGKIGVFGVSNFSGASLTNAANLGAAVAELPLNLIDRHAELDIAWCGSLNLDVFAYGPYAQGLLCGRYDRGTYFEDTDRRHRLPQFTDDAWDVNEVALSRLQAVAGRRNVTEAEVALQWVLAHPDVSCTIVGARNPSQVNAALSCSEWMLSDEDYSTLSDWQRRDI